MRTFETSSSLLCPRKLKSEGQEWEGYMHILFSKREQHSTFKELRGGHQGWNTESEKSS